MGTAEPGGGLRRALAEARLRRRRARATRRRRAGRATAGLAACLVVLLAAVLGSFGHLQPEAPGRQLTLDQLAALTEQARIAEVTLLDEDARIVGRATPRPVVDLPAPAESSAAPGARVPAAPGRFWVAYPRNDATTNRLIERLTSSGAEVRVDPQTSKATVRVVLTVLLPLVILANLFALFFVAGRGGGGALGEVTDFSRLTGRRAAGGRRAAVGFRDVAGADEAVAELSEVVDYLSNPGRYERLGATPPKGVLLFGPPGCGKTLLAKAVAGEAGVPFFSVAGAEFVESLVGVGAARVRDLFGRVRAAAPAIVFIDELDAAGRRRGGGGGNEERDQTLNQLLVEMDGFDVTAGIVVIGATNRPDILDPALLRPGRFDRHIVIERPDLERRQAILELHAAGRPMAGDVDFTRLARQTPGFSGADLASVVNEAALLTIREGGTAIGDRTLREAVDRVLAGPQRRGHLMGEEERHRLAVHEGGRAVVGALLASPPERVSIVARSRDLAASVLERAEDVTVLTEGRLRDRLVGSMAARAAELAVFGDASTGTEADLAAATAVARDLAARHGMAPGVGARRLLGPDVDADLGAGTAMGPLGPAAHDALDAEVAQALEAALARAGALVRRHRPALDRVVERLLRDETLEGPELWRLLPRPGARRRSAS